MALSRQNLVSDALLFSSHNQHGNVLLYLLEDKNH
jgi:hypothetical protein